MKTTRELIQYRNIISNNNANNYTPSRAHTQIHTGRHNIEAEERKKKENSNRKLQRRNPYTLSLYRDADQTQWSTK